MAILPPPYTVRKSSPSPPKRSETSSTRNRSLSVRSSKSRSNSEAPVPKKHRFTFSSLRGNYQPELSRRLFRLIKSENHVINSYEAAGHERQAIATQLSEWGEQTGDDSVSELSDKLGVILSELGAQEEVFAQNLEDYRSILKQIRNTESSVQPSRDHKTKIQDEIARLKYKEPTSTKLTTLEQELVRAEAENLVAEAQLTNVTRAKLKEAYAQHFAAVVERSEKQAILAKHGRRMLNLLNDAPVVPGDIPAAFDAENEARQILNDAEEDLRNWTLELDEVASRAHAVTSGVLDGKAAASQVQTVAPGSALGMHPAHRGGGGTHVVGTHPAHRKTSGSSAKPLAYPLGEEERAQREDMLV